MRQNSAAQDGRIDWTRPAEELLRRVRALNPWPGVFTTLDGAVLKVLAADADVGRGAARHGARRRLAVACGAGAIRLLRVQRAGGAAMDAAAFLRGHPLRAGARVGIG